MKEDIGRRYSGEAFVYWGQATADKWNKGAELEYL